MSINLSNLSKEELLRLQVAIDEQLEKGVGEKTSTVEIPFVNLSNVESFLLYVESNIHFFERNTSDISYSRLIRLDVLRAVFQEAQKIYEY